VTLNGDHTERRLVSRRHLSLLLPRSLQPRQQCAGLHEIARFETFAEPAIDRHKDVARLLLPAVGS
jgi:hypothetical protein